MEHLVSASKQSTNLYDIYLMLCLQSLTPDYGRKDRQKHIIIIIIIIIIYLTENGLSPGDSSCNACT